MCIKWLQEDHEMQLEERTIQLLFEKKCCKLAESKLKGNSPVAIKGEPLPEFLEVWREERFKIWEEMEKPREKPKRGTVVTSGRREARSQNQRSGGDAPEARRQGKVPANTRTATDANEAGSSLDTETLADSVNDIGARLSLPRGAPSPEPQPYLVGPSRGSSNNSMEDVVATSTPICGSQESEGSLFNGSIGSLYDRPSSPMPQWLSSQDLPSTPELKRVRKSKRPSDIRVPTRTYGPLPQPPPRSNPYQESPPAKRGADDVVAELPHQYREIIMASVRAHLPLSPKRPRHDHDVSIDALVNGKENTEEDIDMDFASPKTQSDQHSVGNQPHDASTGEEGDVDMDLAAPQTRNDQHSVVSTSNEPNEGPSISELGRDASFRPESRQTDHHPAGTKPSSRPSASAPTPLITPPYQTQNFSPQVFSPPSEASTATGTITNDGPRSPATGKLPLFVRLKKVNPSGRSKASKYYSSDTGMRLSSVDDTFAWYEEYWGVDVDTLYFHFMNSVMQVPDVRVERGNETQWQMLKEEIKDCFNETKRKQAGELQWFKVVVCNEEQEIEELSTQSQEALWIG